MQPAHPAYRGSNTGLRYEPSPDRHPASLFQHRRAPGPTQAEYPGSAPPSAPDESPSSIPQLPQPSEPICSCPHLYHTFRQGPLRGYPPPEQTDQQHGCHNLKNGRCVPCGQSPRRQPYSRNVFRPVSPQMGKSECCRYSNCYFRQPSPTTHPYAKRSARPSALVSYTAKYICRNSY